VRNKKMQKRAQKNRRARRIWLAMKKKISSETNIVASQSETTQSFGTLTVIDEQTHIGVRILQSTNIDGLVHLLVEKNPSLAEELSNKIAWKIQDNELIKGDKNAS